MSEPVPPAPCRRPAAAAGHGGHCTGALLALALLAPACAPATELELSSAALRARVGDRRVLGQEQPESFREVDAMLTYRLPWSHPSVAGWEWGTRLLASAGVIRGADKTALAASLIPVLAFGRPDGGVAAEIGAGLGLLSKHRYAQQDFGGHLQFALTFSVTVPLLRPWGIGYRFLHYSDAGLYGPGTIGADFHMVEFSHRF